MISPYTGGATELVHEQKKLLFRKESFEIVYHSWKCIDTNEFFTTDELDKLNIIQVHNKYREKHKIPFPDQIRFVRSKYGFSAAKMSELLGFGINTWRNYESGEVPQISNGRLINLAADANEFKKLIEISDVFSGKELLKIRTRIEHLIEEEQESNETLLKQLLSLNRQHPDVFSGYREIKLNKFLNMILFFAETVQPMKTKLNKLLFYADFLNYKKTGFSISGSRYVAINLGPVPNDYNTLFEFFLRDRLIDVEYVQFENQDNIGEKFIRSPDRSFEQELFDEKELSSLQFVANQFNAMSTQDIIALSHNEKAWKVKEMTKSFLEYDDAFELSIG